MYLNKLKWLCKLRREGRRMHGRSQLPMRPNFYSLLCKKIHISIRIPGNNKFNTDTTSPSTRSIVYWFLQSTESLSQTFHPHDHSLLETGPLPSANCFAECQKSGTRQRPSLPSAALGKELHSAKKALSKGLLCRVPGSRQKHGTRHRLPRVTVFGHVLLCRAPAVRHSGKICFFLFLISLPSAPDLALGKDLNFFFNSLPSVSDLALGKEIFFIFKILCRVPPGRHSAKI